jgi:hypothetical protein
VVKRPQLATAVLEMHVNHRFREEVETLSGIITTNHDGLLQTSCQEVFHEVNLGFPFVSQDITPAVSARTPPVLQVHGSFTWRFAVPIEVTKLRRDLAYSPDTIWIPPTILKESKNYPFNKVAGLAYELLAGQCDVLRVVGCSLTQNDWNVLSLIFNAQRHRELEAGSPFRVELIMQHRSGEWIKKECSYLKSVAPIGYLTEGQFAAYKDDVTEDEAALRDPAMRNPLWFWLKEKINYHRKRDEFGPGALSGMMAKIAGDVI